MVQLTKTNKDKLKEYLSSIKDNTELEIRFGTFTYDMIKKKSEFDSSVGIEFFYNLKNALDNKHKIKSTNVNTRENSYHNPRGNNIREIIYTNEHFVPIANKENEYLIKDKLRYHEIYDYDIRVSFSGETLKNKNDIKEVNFNNITFIRYKQRFSYIFEIGRLDLTIVHQGNNEEETSRNTRYEVEFEINQDNYDELLLMMAVILQIKQKNIYVISKTESRDVRNEYGRLANSSKSGPIYFIGAQPETLQKDKLSNLFKELYSVTDKADGDRFFMFINNQGNVYYIDNNINQILKTNLTSNIKNTLIDGELIENKESDITQFYAFDILFYNNQDLRGNKNYMLKERLELLNKVINNTSKSEDYKVDIKKFIYRNVFIGSETIMKNVINKPYKNDGLIFTPMNEPYPVNSKWDKLFKWKPAELNTIDFFSVKYHDIEGTVKWKLYIQAKDTTSNIKNATKIVLFDVTKLCDTPDSTDITFETTFDDTLLDPTTNQCYKTNTVIEYKWDKTVDGGKFVPLRTRWDKTANKKKHGNFVHVACSIWNNINNPITPQQLYQMTNSTTSFVGEKPFFFERFKNLNSNINKYFINKYIKNDTYLLELNTNLDLLKKKNMDTKNITVFTFNNIIKTTSTNYLNFKLELDKPDSSSVIKQKFTQFKSKKDTDSFDNCVIFNAGLFLKSRQTFDNLIRILDYNLKVKSKIVISFINRDVIKDSIYMKNNEIMYYIQNNNSTSNWSSEIKVFINGISNENNLIEYCVSEENIIKYFEEVGYRKINFSKSDILNHELSSYEQDINNIYTFCVFEKYENRINNLIETKNTIETIQPREANGNILKYQRISTNYDLFNILNCINCKYTDYKYLYKIKDITSFEDISDMLKDTEYLSYFVDNKLSNESNIKQGICFHKYEYEEEISKDEEKLACINFYIITHHNTIVSKIDDILYELQLPVPEYINNKTVDNKTVDNKTVDNKTVDNKTVDNKTVDNKTVDNKTVDNKIVDNKIVDSNKTVIDIIRTDVNTLKSKITIVQIKKYLRELNCKLAGNKSELLQRLNNELDI